MEQRVRIKNASPIHNIKYIANYISESDVESVLSQIYIYIYI